MKNILIKTSGDTSDSPKLLNFIKEKSKNNKVVVICGGGTQINKELIERGFKIKYGPHGRVLKTKEEDEIVRRVLEEERRALQNELGKKVVVVSPIVSAGPILCHINADNLVKSFYLGFEKIFVFTLKDRIKNKKEDFKGYSKVNVAGI